MNSKKFSIGLSLLNMSCSEFKFIIDKYKDYIEYVYYSPNIKEMFSRELSKCEQEKFDKINDEEQYKLLKYIKSLNIKTELVINTKKNINCFELEKILCNEKNKFIPDRIGTFNCYIDKCLKYFPDAEYNLSYNEALRSVEQLDYINKKFSSIVVGNKWIRNKHFMNKIKEKGFKINLLVNNGCSHNCNYCYTDGLCDDYFMEIVSENGINVPFAIFTIFPFEIYEYYEKNFDIDIYKISTRPFNFLTTIYTIDSYINNINSYFKQDEQEQLLKGLTALKHYEPFLKFVNLEVVKHLKKEMWKKIL